VIAVQVTHKNKDGFLMRVNGAEKELDVSGTLSVTGGRLNITCLMDKRVVKSHVVITTTDIHLFSKVRDACIARTVFCLQVITNILNTYKIGL
jgi:hypothetical protein